MAKPRYIDNQDFTNHFAAVPGVDIAKLAVSDPVLALALLQSPAKQPQIYTMRALFVSGALDEQVDAFTGDDNGFCSDMLILDARYQIRRNNANAGSLFKGQEDFYYAQNSGINVTLDVQGQCPKFYFVDVPTPIEMTASASQVVDNASSFPYGFVAPKCGRIHGRFTNTRPFAGIQGPVEVFMAFRGISLGAGLQTIDLPFAVGALGQMGIPTRSIIVDS